MYSAENISAFRNALKSNTEFHLGEWYGMHFRPQSNMTEEVALDALGHEWSIKTTTTMAEALSLVTSELSDIRYAYITRTDGEVVLSYERDV
jgi:hypothetical protein